MTGIALVPFQCTEAFYVLPFLTVTRYQAGDVLPEPSWSLGIGWAHFGIELHILL